MGALQTLTGLGTSDEYASFVQRVQEGWKQIPQAAYFRSGSMTLRQLVGVRSELAQVAVPAIQKQDKIAFKGAVIDIATRKPMGASTVTEWVQSNAINIGARVG